MSSHKRWLAMWRDIGQAVFFHHVSGYNLVLEARKALSKRTKHAPGELAAGKVNPNYSGLVREDEVEEEREKMTNKEMANELRELAYRVRDWLTTGQDVARLTTIADQLDPPTCDHSGGSVTDYEVGSGSPFNVYCATCGEKLSGPHYSRT